MIMKVDQPTVMISCTKVRSVLDYLVTKFQELYKPNTNICIDEGMLLWRGHLAFKVYNHQKPVKYGIKSYNLCDSETGYCFNLKPYCGESASLGDTVVSPTDCTWITITTL